MSPSLVSVFGGATVLRASNLLVFQRAAHSPPGTTASGDKILHFRGLLIHGPRLCSWTVQMLPVCVQSLLHQRHTRSRWLVNSGIPLPFGNSKVKKTRSWKSKIAILVNIIHIWTKSDRPPFFCLLATFFRRWSSLKNSMSQCHRWFGISWGHDGRTQRITRDYMDR
jgi:hypothetical protein